MHTVCVCASIANNANNSLMQYQYLQSGCYAPQDKSQNVEILFERFGNQSQVLTYMYV